MLQNQSIYHAAELLLVLVLVVLVLVVELLADDSVFAAGVLDSVAAGAEAGAVLASLAKFFFLSEPLLKSVSYQPPPFRRKPAAEIFLNNSDFLQAGQSFKGSSLSFCKTSIS